MSIKFTKLISSTPPLRTSVLKAKIAISPGCKELIFSMSNKLLVAPLKPLEPIFKVNSVPKTVWIIFEKAAIPFDGVTLRGELDNAPVLIILIVLV